MRLPLTASLVLSSTFSTGALAFESGDRCVLKAPLELTVRTGSGEVKIVVEAKQEVDVRGVGDLTLRVQAGDAQGIVSTTDLEAACKGTLRLCHLQDAVVMQERTDGTGRSFRIKAGADLSVLRQGRSWGHVRIGDLEGFVKTPDLETQCRSEGQAERGATSGIESAPATGRVDDALAVDRGDGPGVLVVPFYLAAPSVSAKVADALSGALFDELGVYRPDAVYADAAIMMKPKVKTRIALLKPAQEDALRRAQAAGTAFAMAGVLEESSAGYVLSVVVIDAKTGKVVKAVKARPTAAPEDPWATAALAVLLPAVPAAPGSTIPKAPRPKAAP